MSFFLAAITFYQTVLSVFLKQVMGLRRFCSFTPTCSEYARLVIVRYGVMKGVFLTAKRLLACI